MATRAERLSREDWIRKATDTLIEAGLGAIRVEPLARDLDVTKGSFYWHFPDHQALLDALVESWEADAKARVDRVRGHAPEPALRLRHLLETESGGRDAKLDLAMRAWAMHDAALSERVRKVDALRLGLIEDNLRAIGFDTTSATTCARLMYQGLLGEQAVREPADEATRRRVLEVMQGMAGRPAPSSPGTP